MNITTSGGDIFTTDSTVNSAAPALFHPDYAPMGIVSYPRAFPAGPITSQIAPLGVLTPVPQGN
jgi:hypothetical protein